MYDRGLGVLEQYGLEAIAVHRGRGALICDTQEGTVLIKEFCGTPRKLEGQAQLLKRITEETPVGTDEILQNKEGSFITLDSENIPYVVKRWYEGRECAPYDRGEILRAMKALAQIHKAMKMPVQCRYVRESLCSEFTRHNRELRKIRKFICAKIQKNEFERCFLDSISDFLAYAEEALQELSRFDFQELKCSALNSGCVCHGEYNQHNVLFLKNGSIAVTNFDKWNYDVQTADIYQFMRKILEKHSWDDGLGREMLLAYHKVRPLKRLEVQELRLRFSYPEKYWKLANHYYTRKKAWISQKSVEKIKKLTEQQERWRSFLEKEWL